MQSLVQHIGRSAEQPQAQSQPQSPYGSTHIGSVRVSGSVNGATDASASVFDDVLGKGLLYDDVDADLASMSAGSSHSNAEGYLSTPLPPSPPEHTVPGQGHHQYQYQQHQYHSQQQQQQQHGSLMGDSPPAAYSPAHSSPAAATTPGGAGSGGVHHYAQLAQRLPASLAMAHDLGSLGGAAVAATLASSSSAAAGSPAPESPRRSRLKARSRSGSPNPRAQPYLDASPQSARARARASSASFDRALAARSMAQPRQRVYSSPDWSPGAHHSRPVVASPSAAIPSYAVQPTLNDIMEQRRLPRSGTAPSSSLASRQMLRTSGNVEEELSNLFSVALSTQSPAGDRSLRERELPQSFWSRSVNVNKAASSPAASSPAPSYPPASPATSMHSIASAAADPSPPSAALPPGMDSLFAGFDTSPDATHSRAHTHAHTQPHSQSMSHGGGARSGEGGYADTSPSTRLQQVLDRQAASVSDSVSSASTTNTNQTSNQHMEQMEHNLTFGGSGADDDNAMDALLREFGASSDIQGLELLGSDTEGLSTLLNAEMSLMEMGDASDYNLFGDVTL